MAEKTTELLKKVRKIEIRTKALSQQIFAGEYHSAFKGRGMAFSEVREYQYGDDVRNMDWNVTARLDSPSVKVFEEEREMTVVLMIDVSRSGLFGTRQRQRRDLIAEVAAVLAFSAIINNDKVGALFFSEKVEKFIPPKKGRSHLLRIIKEIIEFEPEHNGTNISEALRFLTNAIKKKSTAFLLSDMLDVDSQAFPKYEDALKVSVNRHSIGVIKIYDPMEEEIPNVGFINVKDSENMASSWINTSNKKLRESYKKWFIDFNKNTDQLLNKYKVDNVRLATDCDYVKNLMLFFNKR